MSGFTERLIGLQLGGYVVRSYIARGGMGVVYEGYQASLDRSVAIKVLYPHLSDDPSFIERFQREGRAVAQLRHPHIVGVIDSGADQDYYYMVMELIRGQSLRGALVALRQSGQRMAPTRVFEILQQVGSALTYAHRRGIVHRDIKPGNILMDEEGRVALSDFGLVKLVEGGHLTATGAIIGTPEYMAPEQFMASDQVGPAADQYALAVVAYEMLIGRVPFSAPTPVAIIQQHISEPPPPLRDVDPTLPEGLEAVILRGLAKSAEQRFPSVDDFVRALLRSAAEASGPYSVTLLPLPSDAVTPGHTPVPMTTTELYRPTPESAASVPTTGAAPTVAAPIDTGPQPGVAAQPADILSVPAPEQPADARSSGASLAASAAIDAAVTPDARPTPPAAVIAPPSSPSAPTEGVLRHPSPEPALPVAAAANVSVSTPTANVAAQPSAVPAAAAKRGGRLPIYLVAGALVIVVGIAGALFVLGGGDGGGDPTATSVQAAVATATDTGGAGIDLGATVTFVLGGGETPTPEPTPTEQSSTAPTETTEGAPTATATATSPPSPTTVVIRPIAPTPTRSIVQMPIPTPDPNATAVPTAEPIEAGNLTTLLAQEFSTGEAGAFATGQLSLGSAELVDGRYVLNMPEPGWQTSVPNPPYDLADGGVGTVAKLSGDGSVGVIARSRILDNGSYQFYLCWINGQGGGGCHLWSNDAWTELFSVANGTIALTGDDQLLMTVVGNEIKFQVNDQSVGQVTDDTIPSGNWGLYVGSYTGATSASFSLILIAEFT